MKKIFENKLIRFFIFFCILIFVFTSKSYAIVNPLDTTNNKFGIHIIDENDLTDAANLVNSSGGKWGYITLVITEKDHDVARWQRVFDSMRRLQVIPIVRLATRPDGGQWEKPTLDDAYVWANFLNQLNWVVKNRYIVLFNEPNHANEWGGNINPGEYVEIVKTFKTVLKGKSEDFFILPAGFDQAAGTTRDTLDIVTYYQQMYMKDSSVFTLFDGWTVHAYPNPNFSGSPYDTGRRSIRGFEWELSLLSQYGLPQNSPIFITETGWAHNGGENNGLLSSETVASFYNTAFNSIWNDSRIVVISPFVLNYKTQPFAKFSWKKPDSESFYPAYNTVKDLPKQQGNPIQIEEAQLILDTVPHNLTTDSLFFLPVVIRNTGQSIWNEQTNLTLSVIGATEPEQIFTVQTNGVEPFRETRVKVPLQTSEKIGSIPLVFKLKNMKTGDITEVQYRIQVEKPKTVWGKLIQFIKNIKRNSNTE